MEKKIAVVTGASRGIGQAILHELSKDYFVVGTATSESGVKAINDYCQEHSIDGKGYVLDISNLESITNFAQRVQDDYEAPACLVNNAGITQDNLAMRMKPDEWLNVINTNLSGVFYLTQKLLRGILKHKDAGRIINIGSIIGSTGNPGQVNYAAAKAGVVAMSKSLALEVAARGVTVNVISPGFIATDMTDALSDEQKSQILDNIPSKKMGSPQDIANVVGFLASDKAAFITGSNIPVNGGMFMN